MADKEATAVETPEAPSTKEEKVRADGGFPDKYVAKQDLGPPRYEDSLEIESADTPLSAKEVDPEDSRKDETTLLAGESFPGELKK